MAKILVIEDDAATAEMIADCLTAGNYLVEVAQNGKDGLDLLKFYHFDLVILDWQLPLLEGIDVLRMARASGLECPVLFLTGKSSETDKVTGLESGAEDYLCKPFDLRELRARVKALLRRSPSATESKKGQLRLNKADYSVELGERKAILLPKEFALMEHLLRNGAEFASIASLAEIVWQADLLAVDGAIRTCVKRLRRKFEDELEAADLIESQRGIGYRIAPAFISE